MTAALVTVEAFAELISLPRSTVYELVTAGVVRVTNVAKPGAKRARLRVAVTEVDRIARDRQVSAPKRGAR